MTLLEQQSTILELEQALDVLMTPEEPQRKELLGHNQNKKVEAS